MKQIFQGIAFVLMVIGGFWVGMKWGAITPTGTSVSPAVVPPVVSSVPVAPETVAPVDVAPSVELTPVMTAGIDNGAKVDLPLPKNDKVNHYENSHFGYGFDVPANVYYSGFGGQGTALHTVGIAKDVPETFADSAIRILFYGKKVLPELQNAANNRYEDPAGKYVLLLLNGQSSVRIEAENISNPVVQKIVQTIAVTK